MSLQFDYDVAMELEGRRKVKRQKLRNDFPPGPRTHAEADAWVTSTMNALRERGLQQFNVDFAVRLVDAMQPGHGVCLRTDYSGMGGPEEALHEIVMALGIDSSAVICQRAGDIDESAMTVLKCRGLRWSSCSECCVHHDIVDRCPPQIYDKMIRLQKRYLRLAAAALAKAGAPPKRAVYEKYGRSFIKQAVPLVAKAMAELPLPLSAYCWTHHADCPIFPLPPPGFGGSLCSVAGVSCYDFSNMGVGKQFLGTSGPAFAVWCAERLIADEDFFVAECVTSFDDETLAELLDGKYSLYTLRACPTLFGLPIARDRKYMVCLSKRRSWHPAIHANGPAQSFQKLFERQVMMRGDELLRAPVSKQNEFLSKLATQRNLPPFRSSGSGWSNFLVMTHAQQKSLGQHEDALRNAGLSSTAPVLTNLSQRAQHMGPVLSGYVPTLLRRSKIWSFRLRRMVLPEECIELQGYNLFGHAECRSPIQHAMAFVKDSAKKSLAGNAMHVQSIGSVLIFVLACTVPQ